MSESDFVNQDAHPARDATVARVATPTPATHAGAGRPRRALITIDPGWLFLAAGVMVIAAAVLIPAQRDLTMARWQRDKATAIKQHRDERISRYGSYLSALDRQDETVVLSLVGTQLNQSPQDRVPILPSADPTMVSASVFPSLEPEPLRLIETPDLTSGASRLERWATNREIQPWMLAGGVLCVLIGLLPASRGSGQEHEQTQAAT